MVTSVDGDFDGEEKSQERLGQWLNSENPGCLVYLGDYTMQLYIGILINPL